jgi:AraC family transcriptional activator FtrA
MSRRTLQRAFKAATGLAPYEWLLAERIACAKELLETTQLSAQGIALRSGMGSAESLRHHFRKRVGATPSAYRRRFSRRTSGKGRRREAPAGWAS